MRRTRWTGREMRALLDAQESSGLSLKAFAEREGVPYTTMSWWRGRLAGAESPRFVPFELGPDGGGGTSAVAAVGPPSQGAAIEIVAGDVVVRVLHGDEAAVVRLVQALRTC